MARKKQKSAAEKAAAIEDVLAGEEAKVVAARYGVTVNSIYYWMRAANTLPEAGSRARLSEVARLKEKLEQAEKDFQLMANLYKEMAAKYEELKKQQPTWQNK